MKQRLTVIVLACVFAVVTAVSAQENPADSQAYRAQSGVQLNLLFQGLAEGQLSRGLRLFGAGGRCQAWYTITDVVQAPANLDIHQGDRLNLAFHCGKRRQFVSESGITLPWAQPQGAYATVWLRRADIESKRFRTWEVANPNNLFAPVGLADDK